MSKKRFSAAQALQRLQKIADDDSGANNALEEAFDDVEDDLEANNAEIELSISSCGSSDESSDTDEEQQLIEQHMDESIQAVANRAFIASDDDSPTNDENDELRAKDGTQWFKLTENAFTKQRNRIDFKEKTGPTTFAARKIDQTALSAFFCIFDKSMLKMIRIFTNAEAEGKNVDFSVTDIEILPFTAILIARGTLWVSALD
jgi:hypothetical protein